MLLTNDLRQALDPVVFSREQLGFNPDPWQADVLRSTSLRLLLNCSRQSGKSSTAAVMALHRALYRPRSLVLMVSPSLRQSSELYRKVRTLAGEMAHPPAMREDTKTSATLDNESRIVSLPSSESTIRGYSGVDLLIEDEASRVPDALYYATRPMLATSAGQHVLMTTPWGRRGHFYEAWEHGGDGWERIKIDAYQCPRISAQFLEEERRTLGAWWFAQEYECTFSDTTDQVFATGDIEAAFGSDVQPFSFVPLSVRRADHV